MKDLSLYILCPFGACLGIPWKLETDYLRKNAQIIYLLLNGFGKPQKIVTIEYDSWFPDG